MPKKPEEKKLIFVSHATDDRRAVDELVRLIITGTKTPPDLIYQSSSRSLGTPAGDDFRVTIGQHLNTSKIVIIVMTTNYMGSPFCLGEMGAAWALNKRIFVLIVGDTRFSDVKGFLETRDIGTIDDQHRLTEMATAICKARSVQLDEVHWEIERDAFLEKIGPIASTLPSSKPVPKSDYDKEVQIKLALQKRAQVLTADLAKKEALVNKIIDDKVTAEEARQAILDELPETEQFVELCEQLEVALEGLDVVVLDAIRLYLAGEHLNYRLSEYDTDTAYNRNIDEAIDSGQLTGRKGDYPHVQAKPNLDNMDIETAVNQAGALDAWLETSSTTVRNVLRRHYGFTPDLANTEFWKAIKRGKHNTLLSSED